MTNDRPLVLIVEDDQTIARALELELLHASFDVRRTDDGRKALDLYKEHAPDLIVLDLMLPGLGGLDVARTIRHDDSVTPILMLTAKADTSDLVTGFDAGADDYVRKPFEMAELLSRVKALLKRSEKDRAQQNVYEASGVQVDLAKRQARVADSEVQLTAKEFDLLAYLVMNSGRVVPRDEILESVWGGQHATDSNVIEVFVCHLRNKIGDDSNRVIQTIRGVGYFFARD
jgi:two-component system, OmpR family, response regulator